MSRTKSRTKRTYPNGYQEKINYWSDQFDKAVMIGDVEGIDKASTNVRYFIEKQTLWALEKVKKKQEDEMAEKSDVLKFWCESSYDFEDKEKKEDEYLVVAVDMGEGGTKTIGNMEMSNRDAVETLLTIINLERFGS